MSYSKFTKSKTLESVERELAVNRCQLRIASPSAPVLPPSPTTKEVKSRSELVLSFRAILRGGKVTTLHRWLEEARKTGIHSLVRFVRTLKQDLSAVEAAVSKPWSNGLVEGQLNRLKMLQASARIRPG
jgi:hypothetical protein